MIYNQDTFFYLKNGKIIACNLFAQTYYALEKDYFDFLLKKSGEIDIKINTNQNKKIESNLVEGGLLLEKSSEQILNWEGDPISYYFHQGTRINSSEIPELDEEAFCRDFIDISTNIDQLPFHYIPRGKTKISLTIPNLKSFQKNSLYQTIKKRKTSRTFNKTPIKLGDLSSLLYFCLGPIHGHEWAEFDKNNIPAYGARRASPSAAAMEGTDAYVIASEVKGLEKGIYYYDSLNHNLYLINNELPDNFFTYSTSDQFWSNELSAGIFLISDMERTWVKDKKGRGYSAVFLEAGHLSQNILLAATALGIHTWMTGTFRDDYVSQMLEINGVNRFASFFIGLGYGDNESIPKKFIEILKKTKEN